MDLKIEKISESGVKRFKAIRLKSLKESPDAFGSTYEKAVTWDDENWLNQVRNLNTFMASIGENDVGTARSVIDEEDSSVAWVISMWTSPEARGKKVGSKLIGAIIDWAKASGLKIIKLNVVDSNIAAVRLYEKFGFAKNGITGSFEGERSHITEHQRELKL